MAGSRRPGDEINPWTPNGELRPNSVLHSREPTVSFRIPDRSSAVRGSSGVIYRRLGRAKLARKRHEKPLKDWVNKGACLSLFEFPQHIIQHCP